MLLRPNEVRLSALTETRSLSAGNYGAIDIINQDKVPLRNFLRSERPFTSGEEPGSFSYVPNSAVSFVRNSCIDRVNCSNQPQKEIFLNPRHGYDSVLEVNDVLLCKDANVGDSCLFIPQSGRKYVISSGVVRLNFANELHKYYCLAFLRDEYFLNQLEAKAPRGSTIRHAGTLFMDCLLPRIGTAEEPLLPLIMALVKNMAYAERVSLAKLEASNNIIKEDFLTAATKRDNPNFSRIYAATRLDAGYYSDIVETVRSSLASYRGGSQSLKDAGFLLKRGPNLQKRDLGRSVVSDVFKKNYHVLVYPSDISDNGYLLRETFIGARNAVWYMKAGDILFAAEGTVGKVFVICDERMRFITNIHGLIISPTSKSSGLADSIMLGLYLHFLRSLGYFDSVSVGGQGGSYAVNYWDDFQVPVFDQETKNRVSKLYHSGAKLSLDVFDPMELERAGVFELNEFRIKCQETAKLLVGDIKNAATRSKKHYMEALA